MAKQQEGIQINKYVSNSGFCSRREADKLVEQARVTINGQIAMATSRVKMGDKVAVDDEYLKSNKKESLYLAFNKPKGISSTTDANDKTNIISFINYPKRIFPIGRLDKDSNGLILLTADGDIVNKILRVGNNHDKEYLVTVDKAITPEFIQKMSSGVPILETTTLPCKVKQEGSKKFKIILKQGLNRQIRRMCEHLNYDVIELKRTRIMHIELDKLPLGKWRKLTSLEMERLTEKLSNSSKTEEASSTPKVKSNLLEKPKRKFYNYDKKDGNGKPALTFKGTKENTFKPATSNTTKKRVGGGKPPVEKPPAKKVKTAYVPKPSKGRNR